MGGRYSRGVAAARVRNTLARREMRGLGPLWVLSTERPLLQFEAALGEKQVRAGLPLSF